MSLDVRQFREYVARPVLEYLHPEIPYSLVAENLVLGTALQESRLAYLDQLSPGSGPAYGLCQMERATHDDHWQHFLAARPALADKVHQLLAAWPSPVEQLRTNLAYAVAMCRVHYRRSPLALPVSADDIEALGRIWKAAYNTSAGRGTAAQFVHNYGQSVT